MATALHGIIYEEFPVCAVRMCVCVRGHVCVPCACAYVCVATCVCRVHTHVCVSVCGVARRGGLVCISVLLQSHGYIQYIAHGHHVYLRGWGGEGTEKELKLSI